MSENGLVIRRLSIGTGLYGMLILQKIKNFSIVCKISLNLCLPREKALQPIMNHVDVNMFGSLPLELYLVTKDKKYWYLGLPYADSQWKVPANAKPEEKEWAEKGYSWQTRLWIDDMYMITIVQTQAYKVTKDKNILIVQLKRW